MMKLSRAPLLVVLAVSVLLVARSGWAAPRETPGAPAGGHVKALASKAELRALLIRTGFVYNFARFTRWPEPAPVARDTDPPAVGRTPASTASAGTGPEPSPGDGASASAASVGGEGRPGGPRSHGRRAGKSDVTGRPGEEAGRACFSIAFLTDREDRFSLVEQSLERLEVKGMPVEVKMVHEPEQALGSHMLFVDETFDRLEKLPSWTEDERWKTVLTVGEGRGFIEKGGDIFLYKRRNKLRFGVNLEQCRAKGLKISARVLSLGLIVKGRH